MNVITKAPSALLLLLLRCAFKWCGKRWSSQDKSAKIWNQYWNFLVET